MGVIAPTVPQEGFVVKLHHLWKCSSHISPTKLVCADGKYVRLSGMLLYDVRHFTERLRGNRGYGESHKDRCTNF
jgi:hypothetical protein